MFLNTVDIINFTRLFDSMKTEPGAPFVRLTVSLQPEDERLLTELRFELERKSCERWSMSRVLREGMKCLAERELK